MRDQFQISAPPASSSRDGPHLDTTALLKNGVTPGDRQGGVQVGRLDHARVAQRDSLDPMPPDPDLHREALRLFDLLRPSPELWAKGKPNRDALGAVLEIATAWRSRGLLSYAGFALSMAPDLAWGDGELVRRVSREAIDQLSAAANREPPNGWDAIAGLVMLRRGLLFDYVGMERAEIRALSRRLGEELAERLMSASATSDDEDGVLVRGFNLATEFDGKWTPQFPPFETSRGVMLYGPDGLVLSVSPAFRLLVDAGDYYAARQIAEARPSGFTTLSSLGWRAATVGFLDAGNAAEYFEEAAANFAKDVHDENRPLAAGEGWSSINIDLWAPYFAARAAVARLGRASDDVVELLDRARQVLIGTESGWSNPQVQCFRVLVNALYEILSGDVHALVRIRADFDRLAARFGADDDEQLTISFLETSMRAFDQLATDPGEALTSGLLSRALEILDRISLFGTIERSALRPAIGRRAEDEVLGPFRTWIYRTLESITDERVLQRLVLRLSQAQLPLYAQVLHGPLEYGKDVVALVEANDGSILQMYQIKIGDIATSDWRQAKSQLEEAFDVTLETVQLPQEPSRREAILLFNGHLKANVQPAVDGWIERERGQSRQIRIMNLDAIVQWIEKAGLINELRAAAKELGLPTFRRPAS